MNRLWEYFDIGPRPNVTRIFSAEERTELEFIVASQVASLLALYGSVEESELDESPCMDVEVPTTYRILELDQHLLEDESEFIVTQLPIDANGCDVQPGVYAILHNSDSGPAINAITIHDPSYDYVPLVHHSHGPELELDMLQELYEVLNIIAKSYAVCEANNPPYEPKMYPRLVLDGPIFEPVIAGLSSGDPELN